jgi:two-component system, OmpR family, heavy metal sensor histidine kinase CusS
VESTGAEPAEFADLIGVLNEMMERLERGFGQARRFTADASHELKTPIALIQSGIEEALVDCRAANGDPAVLMSMAKEVRRLKGILEGLLLLSRADAGELRLVNETVDLSRELGLFCEDVEVLAESREIKTELSIAPGVHVCGDRILLGQAIQNLLSNAIKYNCEGGTLWCSLSVENEFVVLEIANTGSVIPREDVPLVFERFYRVDKARSRAVDGIGLGLNIAWEIVKAHQGSLTLERSDERATVFRAVLPLVPQAIEG